jgi:hypothetical protein
VVHLTCAGLVPWRTLIVAGLQGRGSTKVDFSVTLKAPLPSASAGSVTVK